MNRAGLPLALLCLLWLSLAFSAGSEEDEVPDYSLPWHGESPHWVWGQEFSAVMDAPFIGTAECLNCHEALAGGFLQTAHSRSLNDDEIALDRQGCEACHGAGGAHAVLQSRGAIFAFDWEDPAHANRICLRCHEWLTSTREWESLLHAKAGVKCTDCHDPHMGPELEQRFLLVTPQDHLCVTCHPDTARDFRRLSQHPVKLDLSDHPGAQAMHCTDCHDVHALRGPRMVAERRTQDLCLRCHIEKGGPFRFVHMASEEGIGEGCLTCHLPHGSDNAWLHGAEGRAQCIQCHTDRYEHFIPLTCWAAGCHVGIHGSNRNALFF